MLLQFPDELVERIVSYCHVVAMKRLACCSKKLCGVVRPLVWKCVVVPYEVLVSNTFSSEQLENLKYTDVLYLGSHNMRYCWQYEKSNSFISGCRIVLKACNPKVIHCWLLPEDMDGLDRISEIVYYRCVDSRFEQQLRTICDICSKSKCLQSLSVDLKGPPAFSSLPLEKLTGLKSNGERGEQFCFYPTIKKPERT